MPPTERPRGTPSIAPREPIGAAVAQGRKKPGQPNPVDTDRFFIVQPKAEGQGIEAVRKPHPAFATFNALPKDGASREEVEAHNALRTVIKCILVHAAPDDSFWTNMKAQKIQGHVNPKGAPSCEGNDVTARRWFPNPDGSGEYREIPCPGVKCQYRSTARGRPACLPFGMIVFQLRFQNSPGIVAKYTTNGNEATGAIQGFFNHLKEQASSLGVTNPSVYGLPFLMTLSKRTKAAAPGERFGSRWYVPSFTPDLPDGMTLQEFFIRQRDRATVLSQPRLLAPTATEVLDDDLNIINAGSLGEERQ